jgi:hypothetical protein
VVLTSAVPAFHGRIHASHVRLNDLIIIAFPGGEHFHSIATSSCSHEVLRISSPAAQNFDDHLPLPGIFRVHCFSGKIFSQNLKLLHT